jgi:hypothetical protein
MSFIVGVDPGVKWCGISMFEDGNLASAQLLEFDSDFTVARQLEGLFFHEGISKVFCEKMQAYAPGQQKGDQQDLLSVNLVVGALKGVAETHVLGAPVHLIFPREWKGNVPKDVMLNRIMSKLSDEEKERIPKLPKSKLHNVIDAIGIGLWATRRL